MKEQLTKNGKKKWIRGIDYAEFSGMSWKEINDLWPPEVRTSSEAYLILSVMIPAFERFRTWYMQLEGFENRGDLKTVFWLRDLGLLAWFSRVEEAKGGLASRGNNLEMGLLQGQKGFQSRKSALIKSGLVEQFPIKGTYYRVTPKGRLILKKYIEFVEEAHVLIKEYVNHGDEESMNKIFRHLIDKP
jgi:hypothetical protein